MKRDFLEPKNTMLSKFPPFSHHFPVPISFRDSLPTDHAKSPSAAANAAPSSGDKSKPDPANPSDGASIEVVRRPRGRPPGSKNRPKPPVVITRESSEPTMSPYILEVQGGNDIVESVSRFCRCKNIGLCVLAGSGAVADFTIRHTAAATPGATVTFHGRFEILSISATFLPQATPFQIPNAFKISVAGPQGQILGGAVVGPLLAAGPVFVVAATFSNPSYSRLPAPDDDGSNSVSGSGGCGEGQSLPVSGGGGGDQSEPTPESCGVSMYSCQLGSDVIWNPSARPRAPLGPPPPPY